MVWPLKFTSIISVHARRLLCLAYCVFSVIVAEHLQLMLLVKRSINPSTMLKRWWIAKKCWYRNLLCCFLTSELYRIHRRLIVDHITETTDCGSEIYSSLSVTSFCDTHVNDREKAQAVSHNFVPAFIDCYMFRRLEIRHGEIKIYMKKDNFKYNSLKRYSFQV